MAERRRGSARQREESFVGFYTAHFERVFRAAALFCGHADVARDSAQEAFVRAFERWRRLEGEPWNEGWVMTTAFNLCRRSLRRRDEAFEEHVSQPSPERDSIDRLDLSQALIRLPIRQRQTMVLYYYGDLSIDDVARLLDISTGSVKTHLARGRSALASSLSDLEDDHDAR